ncbi:MAG TPA: MarR family transcriptional regulator, partial [Nitrosopumilaceae archaeon]|nr:MarR family transcriptional regulator [Nitrosopumilaceae archaeon]
ESELRKKFLQPRTTMWRAVKRLERQGIIEIEKKDLQNLVKIKNELEDEQ